MNPNLKAFLSMIAWSEGTKDKGDDGYNVIVGGKLFESYADHPREKVSIKNLGIYSTAAGRYQILARYYDVYKRQLGLKDFGPEAQDAIAIQMIHECRAMEDIKAGRIVDAIAKCKSRWASLPGAGYNQPERAIVTLVSKYRAFGGA